MNKTKQQRILTGPKKPLTPKQIHRIRADLEVKNEIRDLALFDLAFDSKLRGCDLIALKVSDVAQDDTVQNRARIIQQKTGHPVRFEITEDTRRSLEHHIRQAKLQAADYLFPSRIHSRSHLSARQYARRFKGWVTAIGLDSSKYGTHTMRRTKASIIYQRTKNIRAVQLLLGHTKLDNTVRYLGVDEDDALLLAEQIQI